MLTAAILVMALPGADSAGEMEEATFVEAGTPVAVMGSATKGMRQEGEALVIAGPARSGDTRGNTLFADLALHEGDFRIHARLILDELTGSGASSLLGGHYHYPSSEPEGNLTIRVALDGEGGRILHGFCGRRQPWSEAEKEEVGKVSDHIRPGEPFTLDWVQKGTEYTVQINGKTISRSTSEGKVRGPSDGGWPANFGFLAPDEAVIRVHDFRATGRFARPMLEQQDVWSLGDDGYSIYRVPGLCVTPQGTLLAFAEARSKDKPQALVTKRSTDGGKTWSEQQIVYAEHSADPSPLIDWQTGELFLALRGRNPRGHSPRGPLQAFLMRSTDDGRSWSDRRPLGILREDMRILTPGPAHGIQLRRGQYRGRLVAPVYFYLKEGRQTCGVAYSDDHDKTWKLGGETPHNTHEPQVCELDDGRLLLTCRDHSKGPEGRGRGVAFSRDGGATFGDYRKDDELPSYGCQATAMRYCLPGQSAEDSQHSPLLFSAPAEGRRRMTVTLSEDDGGTWPVSRLVYAGHSAYSAMRVLPDGRIGLLYERDHYRRVSFATFTLDWLRGRE